MRLTIHALGWTFDWSLEPAAGDDEDQGAALNGGTLASFPVGFTASHEMPEEFAVPSRVLTAPVEDE